MTDRRSLCMVAALCGASGVLAAAFGAHGLEKIADESQIDWWTTASHMQLMTAPALLALSFAPGSPRRAFFTLLAGTCIFCGTLYAMSLGAPRFLGAVTPVGGLLMVAGWALVARAARGEFASRSAPSQQG